MFDDPVKDQVQMTSDPKVDLFNASFEFHSVKEPVDVCEDSREGGGDLDAIRKAC